MISDRRKRTLNKNVGGNCLCYHKAAALAMWTADLISKSDSSHNLIRVLPLCIYNSTRAPKAPTLPTWKCSWKRDCCLVSCILEFLVSGYWNGLSSFGLLVRKQTSLRLNILWQRFKWHLAGAERRSRKITEMSHFPFWACTMHSSGKPDKLGQKFKKSGHFQPRKARQGTRHAVSPTPASLHCSSAQELLFPRRHNGEFAADFSVKKNYLRPIIKTCLLY